MYQYVLFDLDGTLIDSEEGIVNAVKSTLEEYQIPIKDRKELEVFIGPPMEEQFKESFGFSIEKALEAKAKSRKYFAEVGLYQNTLYPKVREVLEELKKRNKTVILATSKPKIFAEKILKQHQIEPYFDFVGGATLDGSISKKEEVIQDIFDNNQIDRKECIMIGDRKYDIVGANHFQIHSIGVLYGFGSKQELEKEKATYIVQKIEDILPIIG